MNWGLFVEVYLIVFLMELPDKTALSILLLSTKHHGWAVFLGAAAAFVIQSLVAVLFGSVIAMLPPHWTHIAAGLLFLYFSVKMFLESRSRETDEDGEKPKPSDHFRQSLINSFVMIFIAEWGDLTQLATATLQVKYNDAIPIFFGSILALWSVTALSILAGRSLKKWLEPHRLQLIGSIIFALVGIYFLITAISVSSL